MKTLSLIGIMISILGMIISFSVIDNHVNFYAELHDALRITYTDFGVDTPNRKIYKTTSTLDTGTNMCFVLMLLFLYFLFISIKNYRNED